MKSFIARGGFWFVFSSLFYKATFILSSIWLIRVMSLEEFGGLEYVKTLTFILVPFFSAGLHESMLYYGARASSEKEARSIFKELLPQAALFSIILSALAWLIFIGLSEKLIGEWGWVISLYPFTQGLFLFYGSYLRAIGSNKGYASLSALSALIYILFVAFSRGNALVVALGFVVSPMIASLISVALFKRNVSLKRLGLAFCELVKMLVHLKGKKLLKFESKKRYGIGVAIGGTISQVGLLVDIVLIGAILNSAEQVGAYKMLTLLPSIMIFIPSLIIKSDFVHIANAGNVEARRYYINYIKTFLTLMVIPLLFIVFFSEVIISEVYGLQSTSEMVKAQIVLLVTSCIACLVRVPLGGMLYAYGRVRFNAFNAIISVLISVALGALLIPVLGMVGAAVAMFLSVIVTSFLQWLQFYKLTTEKI